MPMRALRYAASAATQGEGWVLVRPKIPLIPSRRASIRIEGRLAAANARLAVPHKTDRPCHGCGIARSYLAAVVRLRSRSIRNLVKRSTAPSPISAIRLPQIGDITRLMLCSAGQDDEGQGRPDAQHRDDLRAHTSGHNRNFLARLIQRGQGLSVDFDRAGLSVRRRGGVGI